MAMRGQSLLSVFVAAAMAVLAAVDARAQNENSWFPLKADDGTDVVNYRVPVELESQIEALPGIVTIGNPHGDVTLVARTRSPASSNPSAPATRSCADQAADNRRMLVAALPAAAMRRRASRIGSMATAM
jgi:hypothetical protein